MQDSRNDSGTHMRYVCDCCQVGDAPEAASTDQGQAQTLQCVWGVAVRGWFAIWSPGAVRRTKACCLAPACAMRVAYVLVCVWTQE